MKVEIAIILQAKHEAIMLRLNEIIRNNIKVFVMRKILISLLIICFSCSMQAQNISNTTTMNIQEIADRIALKSLVDTFSNLADTKEIDEQVQLFTADAEVISYQGEKQTSHLKGRKELAERFKAFLDQFTTVYHINGQQTVNIDGDKATGIAYAQVVLVSEKNGKKTMRTQGVRYNDEYERKNGKWLISRRISNFEWSKE